MTERARLFFAVPVPEELRTRLQGLVSGPLRELPEVRTIPAENWHLTLRFLGDTSEVARRKVESGLAEARLPRPFPLRIGGWGAFPRPAAARVLWIGIQDPTSGLQMLNAATETAAVEAGFAPETRPYSPHLTIGRLRTSSNLRSLLSSLPRFELDCSADSVILYRSDFVAGGVRYAPVRSFPLPTT